MAVKMLGFILYFNICCEQVPAGPVKEGAPSASQCFAHGSSQENSWVRMLNASWTASDLEVPQAPVSSHRTTIRTSVSVRITAVPLVCYFSASRGCLTKVLLLKYPVVRSIPIWNKWELITVESWVDSKHIFLLLHCLTLTKLVPSILENA